MDAGNFGNCKTCVISGDDILGITVRTPATGIDQFSVLFAGYDVGMTIGGVACFGFLSTTGAGAEGIAIVKARWPYMLPSAPIMPCGGDGFIGIAVKADRAGVFGITGFCAGGSDGGVLILMTSGNRLAVGVLTIAAGICFGTIGDTGGCDGGGQGVTVSRGGGFCVSVAVSTRFADVRCISISGAGCFGDGSLVNMA